MSGIENDLGATDSGSMRIVHRHFDGTATCSCTYLVQNRSGATGSRKAHSGATTWAHNLTGATGKRHSLPGFTTPAQIRCGATGEAQILLGETAGAHILTGGTGILKVLAGATTTAHAFGLQSSGKQPWHKASPEEIKIKPINTIITRRMQLTRDQNLLVVIAIFGVTLT